jgi:hypothetical protein
MSSLRAMACSTGMPGCCCPHQADLLCTAPLEVWTWYPMVVLYGRKGRRCQLSRAPFLALGPRCGQQGHLGGV